jgi:hypothetical protein
MRRPIPTLTTESHRFSCRDVTFPVNVEYARQNDAANRLMLGN